MISGILVFSDLKPSFGSLCLCGLRVPCNKCDKNSRDGSNRWMCHARRARCRNGRQTMVACQARVLIDIVSVHFSLFLSLSLSLSLSSSIYIYMYMHVDILYVKGKSENYMYVCVYVHILFENKTIRETPCVGSDTYQDALACAENFVSTAAHLWISRKTYSARKILSKTGANLVGAFAEWDANGSHAILV